MKVSICICDEERWHAKNRRQIGYRMRSMGRLTGRHHEQSIGNYFCLYEDPNPHDAKSNMHVAVSYHESFEIRPFLMLR